MIAQYKNRQLNLNDKIQVYRNLNNNTFSIRCAKTKLVLAHGEGFILSDGQPIVHEKSRLKVVEKKSRTVHVYIEGYYGGLFDEWNCDVYDEAYYNPYFTDKFIAKSENVEIIKGDFLFMDSKAYVLSNLTRKDMKIK